mmetsp:Transcript_100553/g.217003  ORF Transcript_100553/g.217003 Transcript_100553/m.217003 type:complete len:110 (+) Transcript_100553:311-640(+)
MESTLTMVLSLCAVQRVVMRFILRYLLMSVNTFISVMTSRLLVTSSSIRMSAWRCSARMIATRCFSPPLRVIPWWPTFRSEFSYYFLVNDNESTICLIFDSVRSSSNSE